MVRVTAVEQARTMNRIVTKIHKDCISKSKVNIKKDTFREVEKRREKSKGREERRCSPIEMRSTERFTPEWHPLPETSGGSSPGGMFLPIGAQNYLPYFC